MASAPQDVSLPLFYNQIEPLSSQVHGEFSIRQMESAPFLANTHAIPVTVEEFPLVQRYRPIVFSLGDEPVPLALMGLNEGVNTYFDADGKLIDENFYLPAYARRYPFMLARLRPDADELSLCFDPTSGAIGKFDDGQRLFENGEPTELAKNILEFNRQFEESAQRTTQFMAELKEMDLLIDGETSIQPEGAAQPFIYRGFLMVNEQKLQELRGDQLRKMVQSGMLPMIYAHLYSLTMMRDVFGRQMRQGKIPQPQLVS